MTDPDLSFVYLFAPLFLFLFFRNIQKQSPEFDIKNPVSFAISLVYGMAALFSLTFEKTALSMLFIVYPIMVLAFLKHPIRKLLGTKANSVFIRMMVNFVLLIFMETFVSIDEYGRIEPSHYLFFIGFYLGLVISIEIIFMKWKWLPRQVFILGGLWGVLIEQNFLVPLMLLTLNLIGIIFVAPFIFLTYSFYTLLPFLLFQDVYSGADPVSGKSFMVSYIVLVLMPLIVWFIVSAIEIGLGLRYPPPA